MPRCNMRPSFYFDTKYGILRSAIIRMAARRNPVEHLTPSICDVEFRLLCFMSAISLAISGTVIFLLV